MERFRIRTGELLGVIGPGLFVLADLYTVIRGWVSPFPAVGSEQTSLPKEGWPAVAAVFGLFIACYLAGFVLRLIPPTNLDWWSSRLRRFLGDPFDNREDHRFPYLTWYMPGGNATCGDAQSLSEATSHLEWLKTISDTADTERDTPKSTTKTDKPGKPKARHLLLIGFNWCKLFVIGRSPALASEVLFAEGISRLVAGLGYATLVSLTAAACVTNQAFDSSAAAASVTQRTFHPWLLLLVAVPLLITHWLAPALPVDKMGALPAYKRGKVVAYLRWALVVAVWIANYLFLRMGAQRNWFPLEASFTVFSSTALLAGILLAPRKLDETKNGILKRGFPALVLLGAAVATFVAHVNEGNKPAAVNVVACVGLVFVFHHVRVKEAFAVLYSYTIAKSLPPQKDAGESS